MAAPRPDVAAVTAWEVHPVPLDAALDVLSP